MELQRFPDGVVSGPQTSVGGKFEQGYNEKNWGAQGVVFDL